jgi:hypothetical protein
MSSSVRRQSYGEVSGPDPGDERRLAHLPPANTRRWVIRRKAEVVNAVRAGFISLEEALARYGLSHEEFESWRGAFARHGLAGLRTTCRSGRAF